MRTTGSAQSNLQLACDFVFQIVRKTAPALLYLVLTCALTWPLARNLANHIPLGAEPTATVPLFNLWTLRWNADQLGRGYTGYWDAPIFYPARGTLALADPQPLAGFAFALFAFATGNDVLAYNLIVLGALTANGYAAYWWLLRSRVASGPALLAGALAASLPFVSNELGVLQLTFVFPIFFALGALYEFERRPLLRPALVLGAWTAVTYLTSGYYGIYLSVFLLAAGAILTTRRHFQARALRALGLGGLLGAALLAPVVSAQLRYTGDHSRSAQTIERNSAQTADFLELQPRAWGSRVMPWLGAAGSGTPQQLYPGTALLLLALVGSGAAWRRHRRWAIFCGVSGLLALTLSLGLRLHMGNWQPYALLRDFYPGFAQLRSPFRLGLFVQVFLIWLAGAGLQALWCYRGTLGRAIAVGVTILGIVEVAAAPAALAERGWREQPTWAQWIAAQPEGAVALLPFAASGRTADFEPTVIGMLEAMDPDHPLVNGYSGFFPQSYRKLKAAASTFPTPESLSALAEAGAVYLAVDNAFLAALPPEQTRELQALFADDERTVFHWEHGPGS